MGLNILSIPLPWIFPHFVVLQPGSVMDLIGILIEGVINIVCEMIYQIQSLYYIEHVIVLQW